MKDDLAFSFTPTGGTKPPLLFKGKASSSSSGAPRLPSVHRPESRGRQAEEPSANGDATPKGRLKAGCGAPSEPAGADRQTSGESMAGEQKTIEQLEATNARLRARCERQERTLVEMGKQLKALRSGQQEVAEQKPAVEAVEKLTGSNLPSASKAPAVDCASQTEDDLMERIQLQQEQLDSIYESVGAKSREVMHLQNTVRNLQKDVQAHQTLSEQFRDQVSELEAQLAEEVQQRHRAEEERTILEWQLRTAKSVRGVTKKGSAADRSTACPSTPGSQLFTEPPSMQSTHTGLPKHGSCSHDATAVSAAAARGAARMAQWADKSDDGSDDETSTSQIIETSLGVSDDED